MRPFGCISLIPLTAWWPQGAGALRLDRSRLFQQRASFKTSEVLKCGVPFFFSWEDLIQLLLVSLAKMFRPCWLHFVDVRISTKWNCVSRNIEETDYSVVGRSLDKGRFVDIKRWLEHFTNPGNYGHRSCFDVREANCLIHLCNIDESICAELLK